MDLRDYDLSQINSDGFASIAKAVRGSSCLRVVTVSGSVLHAMVQKHLSQAVNCMFDMLQGKLRSLVIVVGTDPEERPCRRCQYRSASLRGTRGVWACGRGGWGLFSGAMLTHARGAPVRPLRL